MLTVPAGVKRNGSQALCVQRPRGLVTHPQHRAPVGPAAVACSGTVRRVLLILELGRRCTWPP